MERIDRMTAEKKNPALQRKDSSITEVIDHDAVSAKIEELRRHARIIREAAQKKEQTGLPELQENSPEVSMTANGAGDNKENISVHAGMSENGNPSADMTAHEPSDIEQIWAELEELLAEEDPEPEKISEILSEEDIEPVEIPTEKSTLSDEIPTEEAALPVEIPTEKAALPVEIPTEKAALPVEIPTEKAAMPVENPPEKNTQSLEMAIEENQQSLELPIEEVLKPADFPEAEALPAQKTSENNLAIQPENIPEPVVVPQQAVPADEENHKIDGISEKVDGLSEKVDGIFGKMEDISEKVNALSENVRLCSQENSDLTREFRELRQMQEEKRATNAEALGEDENEAVKTVLDALQDTEDHLSGNLKDIRCEQLFVKKELAEKIHTENVKSYGNMNELFNENASRQDSILSAVDRTGKMKGLLIAAIIICGVNTAALLLLILKSFGLF